MANWHYGSRRDVVGDALYCDGSFRVPEGTLAFAPGSLGWQRKN